MNNILRLILHATIQIAILGAWLDSASADGTLHTLVANGPQERRINVVVLAEGYTAAQESKFVADAGIILTSLLSAPPWSEYRTYVNGYALFVASNQSGADDPSASIFRDTYFNSTFDSYGTARLLTIPPNDLNPNYDDGYGKVYGLLAANLPSFDISVILVNDLQYGGSGGAIAVSSLHASAAEIVLHELGHSHATLGDEYSFSYPGYPDIEEPNTTRQTVRNLVKWKSWIESDVPVPTPGTTDYSGRVGLFEGAHFHSTGWYRPELDCKMKLLGSPYCPICSQAIVLANYALVSPIDSVIPISSLVTIGNSAAETLTVVPQKPYSHSLQVRWFEDGRLLALTGNSISISSEDLTVGAHAIKAIVTDTTSLVRDDPSHKLTDSAAWAVTVASPCACACHGDPNCDGVIYDVLDIILLVDISNNSSTALSTGECHYADADLDCNGVVDVVDVVNAVNVAYHGADPKTKSCDPCR